MLCNTSFHFKCMNLHNWWIYYYLQSSAYNVTRDLSIFTQPQQAETCFICDEMVTGKGIPLLMTYTPYSNTDLPTKIGQLMGDRFMVIVARTDVLCKRCSSLINQLDKLENDSSKVRTMLTEFLKIKYQLTDEIDLEYDSSYENVPHIQNLGLEDHVYIGSELDLLDHRFGAPTTIEEIPVDLKYNFVQQDIKPEIFKNEDACGTTDIKMVNVVIETRNKCSDGNRISLSSEGQHKKSDADNSYSYEDEVDDSVTAFRNSYKCNSCSFITPVVDSLIDHLNKYTDHKSFNHSESFEKFDSQLDIKHPMKKVFTSSKIHGSKKIRELENDPDYYPTRQKIYECQMCKFHHNNKQIFESHMRKHSNLEKFTCRVCSASFKRRISLKKHVFNSHKVLKCHLCSAVFRNKISLANHHEVHNCDSQINTLSDMKLSLPDVDVTEVHYNELTENESSDKSENNVELKCKIQSSEFDQVEDLLEKMHSDERKEEQTNGNKAPILLKKSNVDDFSSINEDFEDNSKISAALPQNSLVMTEGFKDIPLEEYIENSAYLGESNENDTSAPTSNSEIFTVLDDESSLKTCEIINPEKGTEPVCKSVNKENKKHLDFVEMITSRIDGVKCASKKVYVCSLCGLRTSSETHIKRHFKCHIALERKTYKCHICERVLTTRSNLKRHVSLHLSCSSGEMECNMCNEMLTDRLHLKHHMEVKHPESYQCSFCDRRFDSKRACREHELTHPALQCSVCQKMFLTEGRLKSHKILMHSEPGQATNTKAKVFKCHICQKILTTYHNLKRHLRNHEKCSGVVTCVLCNEELNDKLHLRQHVEDKHPENHQCSFCHKVFGNRKSCKAHEMTHPERFVYKCESCDKLFLTEARMKRHQDIMHRDLHCRICGKEISNPLKLLDHERRHERHKVSFPCDQCPKVFRTPSGLKYHMSVHTGKYAVYCEICGKGLHSEVVLEEHKATHTKEVRYTCEKCGRTFSSNSTYRMHRLWHDNPLPYKCNICDRKFKHTSILAVHKRRAHTGERPYKCPHCPQTFSVSSTLNKHIILHTKEYPYRCTQCEKGFTTRTKLARHLAKVHNDFEMLNSKKKACEYKMVLHPSEISAPPKDNTEEPLISVEEILQDQKVGAEEEDEETHAATLEVLDQVTVDSAQAAIFTIFQQDLPNSQFTLSEFEAVSK